jgi:hypothetical protein
VVRIQDLHRSLLTRSSFLGPHISSSLFTQMHVGVDERISWCVGYCSVRYDRHDKAALRMTCISKIK